MPWKVIFHIIIAVPWIAAGWLNCLRTQNTPITDITMPKSKMKVMTAGGAGSGGMKKKPAADTKTTTNEEDPPAFALKETPEVTNPETTIAQHLEMEDPSEHAVEEIPLNDQQDARHHHTAAAVAYSDDPTKQVLRPMESSASAKSSSNKTSHDVFWLIACFFGIMLSFVCYGLLLEYTTSGGRKLHELSFLFVTSGLYTVTAAIGRYVRDEKPSTIPPAQFALLGLTSMGSTFCSVRSLRYVYIVSLLYLHFSRTFCRYVIFPIQVLAKVRIAIWMEIVL